MARGSRSRASRAERRMQKERAASALQHGLPVPTPLPKRAAAAPRVRSNESSPDRARSPSLGPANSNQRMPLAVKLLGIGLGLLGLVYGLTLLRDQPSTPDPAAVRANMTGAGAK
jgi:hypothetical protein